MENLDNDFDERLKRYSEEIRKMEIVYIDGRVRYINNKSINKFKSSTRFSKIENQNDNNLQNNYYIDRENYLLFKYIFNILLKIIFTFIILISTSFLSNEINNTGIYGFILNILIICILYFIINFIWKFLK